jgi:hypothetical protein
MLLLTGCQISWLHGRILCRTTTGQPRGAGKDGDADAGEATDNGPLPALDCDGWFGMVSIRILDVTGGRTTCCEYTPEAGKDEDKRC